MARVVGTGGMAGLGRPGAHGACGRGSLFCSSVPVRGVETARAPDGTAAIPGIAGVCRTDRARAWVDALVQRVEVRQSVDHRLPACRRFQRHVVVWGDRSVGEPRARGAVVRPVDSADPAGAAPCVATGATGDGADRRGIGVLSRILWPLARVVRGMVLGSALSGAGATAAGLADHTRSGAVATVICRTGVSGIADQRGWCAVALPRTAIAAVSCRTDRRFRLADCTSAVDALAGFR